jgi:PIN domain nuclease of toxin-antitoxin system
MIRNVLDSSAVLAVLQQEKGFEKALGFFPNAIVSSVNLAEILTKSIERGHSKTSAIETFNLLQIEVVDFDFEQAAKVAELRPLTKHLGLSLGDRSCLALAILNNAPAVTADKAWKGLAFCQIEVIR